MLTWAIVWLFTKAAEVEHAGPVLFTAMFFDTVMVCSLAASIGVFRSRKD